MIAPKPLTRREQQVLDLIGKGKTSKEIASILKLSTFTVANHRRHICRKLNLHSTAELAVYAAGALNCGCVLDENLPCEMTLNLRSAKGILQMAYRGHLSRKPVSATVSIGSHTFYF